MIALGKKLRPRKAAALDYERQISTEEVALIADIGGGTSDFSIVRLGPQRHGKADRAADILANDGVRIGGTDFDRQLSLGVIMPLFGFGSAMKRAGLEVPSRYFHDLATWSSINRMSLATVAEAKHRGETCWRTNRQPGLRRLQRVRHLPFSFPAHVNSSFDPSYQPFQGAGPVWAARGLPTGSFSGNRRI